MNENNKNQKPQQKCQNKKTEGNNQWTSTNLRYYPDNRERRDGPGGDGADEEGC